ncbi:uncharacterized protein [Amphiura filiformis]|uniref:uncharacterized protein n=1 Tax=Amphiura filiformis TaxID=82378 RepID=UPI003B219C88
MGATVDKIEVQNMEFHERIGEGGFGTVKRVSLKKPYKGYTEAAAKSVLFDLGEQEVKVMSQLKHPHIVTLLGICQTVAADLIIMEYAPNGSLHDYLKDQAKPLPYQLQQKWARESAVAIKYLHGRNYLHRDIKPQNCLLFQDNLLKLCDFGLAREIEQSQTTSSHKGTYRYMAPEIHVGNERGRAIYSKPADVWAYGMLLLEICTRKPPFEQLEWHRVVFEVGSGTKPSIPEGCPKDLSDIMQQCWNSDPKQRPTITLIVKALCTYGSFEREIHPEYQGKSLESDRIACCPNGDIVMSCYENLYLLDADGKCKMQLKSTETDSKKQIAKIVTNLCVSPLGYIFVVNSTSTFVHVFNVDGQYLHCFNTLTAPESDSYAYDGTDRYLAIDREGKLLVDDPNRGIITIHTCPDGKIVNTIRCSLITSNYGANMAVNSKNQILIQSFMVHLAGIHYKAAVAIDYSGEEVFRFTPKTTDKIRLWPGAVICDDQDNIYIVIKSRGANAGHIHIYSPTGRFLQCLTSGLHKPIDLALTHDGSLMVSNSKSILLYSK